MKEDSLHQIIRSLDSSEKRLFKLSIPKANNGKVNLYIELFDVLAKLEVYDETILKKKIKNVSTLKNLAQTKKYLKDLILKSMREIDVESSVDKVNNLLKEAHFLRKKNLFKEQWKKLEKAKVLSKKYEHFSLELDILDIQVKYLIERDFNEALKVKQAYIAEKKVLLDKFSLYHNLLVSKNILFLLIRKNKRKITKADQEILEDIIKNINENEILKLKSFKILSIHYVILSLYNRLNKNNELSKTYRAKILDLYNEYPHFIKQKTSNYLTAYFNYVSASFHTNDFDKVEKLLNNSKNIKLNNFNEKGEFFQNYALNKIILMLNTNKIKEAVEFENYLTNGLNKYKNKINASILLSINYNYSLVYFLNHNFVKAQFWLSKIENIKLDVRKDLQAFSKILNIICHFEMGNYFLIESLSRSVRRGEELTEFELFLVSYVLKLTTTPKNKMKQEFQYFKTLNNKFQNTLGQQEVLMWLNTKI